MTGEATEKKSRTLCPICNNQASNTLFEVLFSKKIYLADSVQLLSCNACDFGYISPADQFEYDSYYMETRNDLVHEALTDERARRWIKTQATAFEKYLASATNLKVLDYGCGEGDLLKFLLNAFPQHSYTGFDLHAGSEKGTGEDKIIFVNSLKDLEKFDLVILSHVLEHFVDLTRLGSIIDLIKFDGLLYIEVPNPELYRKFKRRDFLYYIDRLHVNHFSAQSMNKLTRIYGMSPVEYGNLSLPYADGMEYPSHYFFYRNVQTKKMLLSFISYISAEGDRVSPLDSLDKNSSVLVYGFGDNFFRALAKNGPLASRKILGIVDRRWEALCQSEYGEEYRFFSLKEALFTFKNAPIVIAVTWGIDKIIEEIRMEFPEAMIFTI